MDSGSFVSKGFEMIDEAFYTDEEKAEKAERKREWWLKVQDTLNRDNSKRAITRRRLAFIVIGNTIALTWYHLLVIQFIDVSTDAKEERANLLIEAIGGHLEQWLTWTGLVLGLYFLYEGVSRKSKQKERGS